MIKTIFSEQKDVNMYTMDIVQYHINSALGGW